MLAASTANAATGQSSAFPQTALPQDAPIKPLTRVLLGAEFVLLMLFLASAPARNHDLWLHLGLGKAFAEGRYSLGSEPLLQDPSPVWVNTSWFAEFLGERVFAWFGGLGLSLAKLALATGLIWIVAILSGFRKSPWLA